jgi:hypothetical protein
VFGYRTAFLVAAAICAVGAVVMWLLVRRAGSAEEVIGPRPTQRAGGGRFNLAGAQTLVADADSRTEDSAPGTAGAGAMVERPGVG